MEDFKKKNAADMNDKEIVFSQSIKAGKRIYYLDVKKNRKDEMFLDEAVDQFSKAYQKRYLNKTIPYEGILKLLGTLEEKRN